MSELELSERELFQNFFTSQDASSVVETGRELCERFDCWQVKGLSRYKILKKKLCPLLPFKGQRLFKTLDDTTKRREKLVKEREKEGHEAPKVFDILKEDSDEVLNKNDTFNVVVSGAGPCGLRSAVECLLLGMSVTVLEKRTEFSRVNILMTWQQTMSDLVSVGAKYWYPQLKTHGMTHMGTREMQLCLLKTMLILGGDIFYGVEVTNIRTVSGRNEENPKFSAVCVEKQEVKVKSKGAHLDFKKDKTGDYSDTYKCNMMFTPEVDYSLFLPFTAMQENEVTAAEKISKLKTNSKVKKAFAFDYDALVLAEGEWSTTSSKLGFEKVVDKFNQAIGIVINMQFDKSNKIEKKLKDFSVSKINGDWRNSPLKAINDDGIVSENIEYLRGTTHYVVITVDKKALADKGVLKSVEKSGLLDAENVDREALYAVAREIATHCGIPEETPFCERNAVQIFDFSTRARAKNSHVWMKCSSEETAEIKLSPDEPFESLNESEVQCPIFPIGDTLFEPFWPQGLGSNRGFHGSLDTAFSLLVFQQEGNKMCSQERKFSYYCMNVSGWRNSQTVNTEKIWDADPVNRYRPDVLLDARKTAKFEVPSRLKGIDFRKRLQSLLAK